MIRALLDVNVLIALIGEQHADHGRTQTWFFDGPGIQWLSCPITENGVIRIVANPSYFRTWSMPDVRRSLRLLTAATQHRFVADDVKPLDEMIFHIDRLRSPKQITDPCLLALATHHDAALSPLDARIATEAVRSPGAEVFLVP